LFNFSKIKEALEGYIKVKLELLKLDIAEHLSKLLAQLAAYLVMLSFFGLVVAFLSLGAAFFLNDVFESSSLGFVVVSGFYTILLIVIFVLLKSGKLKSFFENKITSKEKEEIE
jgi:hypothetical protein